MVCPYFGASTESRRHSRRRRRTDRALYVTQTPVPQRVPEALAMPGKGSSDVKAEQFSRSPDAMNLADNHIHSYRADHEATVEAIPAG